MKPKKIKILSINMEEELYAKLKELAWCRRMSLSSFCRETLQEASESRQAPEEVTKAKSS